MRKYGEEAAQILTSIDAGNDTMEKLLKSLAMPAIELVSNLGMLEVEGLIKTEGEKICLLKKKPRNH